MSDSPIHVAPRTFISYSWTSPAHEAWVLDLAMRLVSDGIDIILDKWELRPGHDSYAFMESMVTDPTVTKVIMICDQAYVTKANTRAGGVGTEGQIISPELYGKVAQNKYAALVTEVDERGHRHLPMFYKGRIYFDFVSVDAFEVQYEALLRWLADKPLFVKPSVGRLPEKILTPVVAVKTVTLPKASVISQTTKPKQEKRAPDEAIGRDAAELAVKEANLTRTQGKANRAFRIALAGWVMARENGATIPPQLTTYLGNWCLEGSRRFTIKTASNNDKITAFSPDGKYILIAIADINALQLIDAKSGALIGDPMIHSDAISCAQFSSDGELIATGSNNGEARLWNVATQAPYGNTMQHGDEPIVFVRLSSDRRRLLTCDVNCAVQWESGFGEKIVKDIFFTGLENITNCDYSNNYRIILISGNNNFIKIFDSASGDELKCGLTTGYGVKNTYARIFNNNILLYASSLFFVYDIFNKKDMSTELCSAWTISDIAENNNILILNEKCISVYNSSLRKVFGDLHYKKIVNSAKFSKSGNTIVAAVGQYASLLNGIYGTDVRTPLWHRIDINHAIFSPDENSLLTVCADGDVSAWDISSIYLEGVALIEHICRHHLIDDQEFTDAELRASMIPDLPRNPVAACLAWLEQNR